ncbi:hypothetical protein VP01_4044g3 [Puccinia sorghi]|uniref:Uncharacterized protein n=1 Tax=Puccinia sorghi TaxID=27349 RepID=A0A0L6URP7_9BASI|nr:hypothetical protein VP01_4044g3 [Puccinia sorghi]
MAHSPSTSTPPPSDNPGVLNILTKFKLFMATKSGKNPIWVSIGSCQDFFITITLLETTFNQFQAKVIAVCKENVKNTSWFIQDCLEKEDHELFWYGFLPHVKGWLKCDLVNINKDDLYRKWIDAAVKAKKSESGMRKRLRNHNFCIRSLEKKAMMNLRRLNWTPMNGTTVIFTCKLYTTSILSDPSTTGRYQCLLILLIPTATSLLLWLHARNGPWSL